MQENDRMARVETQLETMTVEVRRIVRITNTGADTSNAGSVNIAVLS